MQKYIIDGYNVLHAINTYQVELDTNLEEARDDLIHDLNIYCSYKKVEMVIVFDGSSDVTYPSNFNTNYIKIIFSKLPQKADNKIIEIIEREQNKKRIIVVTNDNQVIINAKSLGCHCLSSQAFYNLIKTSPKESQLNNKYEHDMTPEELAEWKKIFGIE